MSAELWLASAQTEADYRVARVVAGDADALRPRLVEAVERLGYHVVYDEGAVVARRAARGLASSGCSVDVTEYPTELIVTLKPKGTSATLATFNFNVKNYYYTTKGDRATFEREAEAIAALALSQGSVAACAACGTETTDDSRFCRRCGAPLTSDEPTELEVLRLTAGSRAAQKNVVAALIALAVTLIPAALLFGLGTSPKAARGALLVAAVGWLSALFPLLAASWRLHRTLNPKRERDAADVLGATKTARVSGAPRATNALPPRNAQASVTEGTTELLDAREPLPVAPRRERGDTGPIN
ncbi:MAG TPA: zinc ribbon domain-containing protein [Pyrinomonadaceae bacterium]|nr:zinc ribbon domain-containing protein [Pyrinomonadaceae bacterium]